MRIQNKIGLEAEYLLRDKKGELVFPGAYGFSTDEFAILGEFRADPGKNYAETGGNFFKEMSDVLFRARTRGLVVDFSGMAEISPDFYTTILREVGMKSIPPCKNVYKTDLLKLSDNVVKKGRIVSVKISCGLHVHFSRQVVHEYYEETDKTKKLVTSTHDILRTSDIVSIVKKMDKNVLPHYQLSSFLKYRQPGFYERKSYGFEYRSLPMTDAFMKLENVMWLVEQSFSYLEALEK